MFDKQIIIKSPSESVTKKPYSFSSNGNALIITSDLYKKTGSLLNNSTMMYSDDPENLYREFVNDMDDLSKDNDILEPSDKSALIELDKYFSRLGMDLRYPIKKDISGMSKTLNIIFRKRGE